MLYDMKLDIVPFKKFKSGEKSVEIRLYDEKRRRILAGDSIRFICIQTGEKFTADVLSLHTFPNFLALFQSPLYADCGVEDTPEEAADSMYKYYTQEDELNYGVVGIKLKSINIHSKGDYPGRALSNFCAYQFSIDGILCGSMEGFLQSLKYKSVKKQVKICALSGGTAKKKGKHKFLWKITGNVFWHGKKIKRQSKEFDDLIRRAYGCLFLNPQFVKALKDAKGSILTHNIGKTDKRKTILTRQEFIDNLYLLMEKV